MNVTSRNEIDDKLNNNDCVKKLQFPYDIVPVDDELNKKLLKDFTGEKTGFLQVGPQKWFFPSGYAKEAEIFYNFRARPDDLWIVTFPRSGTTWTQEMVWLLSNDLNYKAAAATPLIDRFPFLEFSSFIHPETKKEFLEENSHSLRNIELVHDVTAPAWKILTDMQERRFIKTHLPFSLLPPDILTVGCKVIYVARNPKDVAVSFYHLNRLIRTQGYIGDFPTYWDYFERNLQPWTPFFEHLKEGWARRDEENLLFMFYEDLSKENFLTGIDRLCKFLGRSYTAQQIDTLEDHLSIDNFRKSKSVNFDIYKELGILKKGEGSFIRKGKNNGWKDYFSDELNQRADKWIEANLKDTDLRFPQRN